MKEQIREAVDYANKENTWVTNVRDYRDIEEMLEGAVERIEQLEQENAALREEAHAECGDCIIKDHRIEQLEKAIQESIESIHCGNRKLAVMTLSEALGREE